MAFVKTGPSVCFSQICWQKMWALVHACDIEISWFMIQASDEEKDLAGVAEDFYFSDVRVVDQVCSGVKSDMKDDAVHSLVNSLLDEGIEPHRANGWGHSHVKMAVGFSGTDEATVERLQLEPLISIILNKDGDVNLRCDQWEPWRHSFEIDDYRVEDIQMIPDDWGKTMVKQHVEKEVLKVPKKLNKKHGGVKGHSQRSDWNNHTHSWGDWRSYYDGYDPTPKEPVVKEVLSLGEGFELLEDLYDDGDISINDVVAYYTAVKKNETTILEMEDELLKLCSYDKPEEEEPKKSLEDVIEDPFGFEEYPEKLKAVGGK